MYEVLVKLNLILIQLLIIDVLSTLFVKQEVYLHKDVQMDIKILIKLKKLVKNVELETFAINLVLLDHSQKKLKVVLLIIVSALLKY